MRMQGEREIDAPREHVWACLMDPEILAGTLPGFQELERVGDDEYVGTLALGVGPVQGRFDGRVQLHDLAPPESYRMHMSGRGTPGFVEGRGIVRLEESGPGTTTLHYSMDIEIGGRLAAVGQRMLDMTGRMLTRRALDGLVRQIEERR